MMNLGGKALGFSSADSSSASKGESVSDTIRVVSCFADICAMRHPKEGAPLVASLASKIPVINAGDGGHQHPTQTLTDLLTIRSLKGRLDNITIGLCGDLWDEKNVMQIKKLRADVVLWPVYTDFSAKEWNKEMKYEYAAQSKKIGRQVLLVNSVSLSGNEEELAKGGAVCFLDGQIKEELPAGKEGVLMVQV